MHSWYFFCVCKALFISYIAVHCFSISLWHLVIFFERLKGNPFVRYLSNDENKLPLN